MNDSAIVERLSKAIGHTTKSARFCVCGTLPDVNPGIEVEGFGNLILPLRRGARKKLVACCQVAPYGKGTQTLVNTKVRKTFELDPEKFRVGGTWNETVAEATRTVAEQLGLPADQLEAKLYKLLVYEKGGFFLPHRDSEKHNGMVASLIVVLPNPFEGGRLIVRHGSAKEKFQFDDAATGKAPCYAAFYADCEHEVERVTNGVRICLAYNLVLKPKRVKRSGAASSDAPDDVLAKSIESWVASQPAQPLVFALEHYYTERGLSLDLLKGADRQLANLVAAAAYKADCFVHMAQVSRHLLQAADDGSFERSYRSRYYDESPKGLVIGETFEDNLNGNQWADLSGEKQPWGEIAFELSSIISSEPIDDWQPTSEDYEGYTGNAGNELDRWYHRSAIVLWHCEHHWDVIASSGVAVCIPLFKSMTAKLAKTPKKHREDAQIECIRFAQAIVARWPAKPFGYRHLATEITSTAYDDFLAHLLMLNDRETISMFLNKMTEGDQEMQLASFILNACRQFGWAAFSVELKCLIQTCPETPHWVEPPTQYVEWLSALCLDKAADPDKLPLTQELCELAAGRFCQPRPSQSTRYSRGERRQASANESAVPLLLKALLASGNDDGLKRVIERVQESPDEFTIDECQVPSLKLLVPWSRKQLGDVHPRLAAWLAAVRQSLESATAYRPAPPADWARSMDLDCSCRYCSQLKAFLADPAKEIGRIAAREDERSHLTNVIHQNRCDVKAVLERKGSPYSLVLTKTNGAYERAVNRFEADQRLLSQLPQIK